MTKGGRVASAPRVRLQRPESPAIRERLICRSMSPEARGRTADAVTYADQRLSQLPGITTVQAIDANRRLGAYFTSTNRTWMVQHAKYDRAGTAAARSA